MKTELWQRLFGDIPQAAVGKLTLFDPTAQAGLWPFVLPRSHWITHAAQFHDPWYDNRKQHGGCKAEGDVRFFNIARIDAGHNIQTERDSLISDIVSLKARWELAPTWEERDDITSEIEATQERVNDLWNEEAERMEVACRCYLIVRGIIGVLAWET